MTRTTPFPAAAAAAAAAVSLVVGPAALAPTAARAQAPADLPSATARTVDVAVTSWGLLPFPQGSAPTPIEPLSKVRVRFDRSGKARFEELSREKAPKGYKLASLVSDGKTVYEMIGARGQYTKTAYKPNPAGALPSRVSLGGPGVPLALGWNREDLGKFAPAADETLGGRTLRVYARTYSAARGEQTLAYAQKLWVDPATRLPVRFSQYVTPPGGATLEVGRSEFSDWTLDAPLPASLFAWTAPEGATEYDPSAKRPELLAVGTPAPDFTVAKWGGGDLKLSDYRGQVVVLDFWATWCGPCQVSMPHFEKVHRATRDKGVAFLGVCVWDEKDAYEKWVPKNREKYTFTFGYDPAGRNANNVARALYNVTGIPTTYVIDRDGKVAAAISGFNPRGDDRLEKALAALGVAVPAADVASAK